MKLYLIKYMNHVRAHDVVTAFSKTVEVCKYINVRVFCKKFRKL